MALAITGLISSTMIYTTIAAFIAALLVGLAVVPVAKRLAVRWNLVDHPDQKRKLHKQATPLVGGISVFISVLASLLLILVLFYGPLSEITIDWFRLGGLLIASSVMLLVGILDDRFALRGRQKLLGQIIAVTILILFDFRFDSIDPPGLPNIDLRIFSILVVYGWILLGINSVNLLDGADGFATTIGLVMSVALCVIAFVTNHPDAAVVSAAMAGALLAFMRFNFPPASAYLGDAGSMLVGLFIAAIATMCTAKEAFAWAFIAPIALLAIPMFDTVAAIVRRRLTGRSIYTVDRGHLHHALMRKGFGPRRALFLFFAMCLMTATGAVMSVIYRQAEYAVLSILAVIIFLIVGRVFGFAEYKLITSRSKSIMKSFLTMPSRDEELSSHHASVRLQGERNWDLCWQVLREFAEGKQLHNLTMDLNLPWIHESFHAKFTRAKRTAAPNERWTAEIPLVVKDRIIGRIDVQSSIHEHSFGEVVAELNEILDSLQPFFIETIESSLEKGAALSAPPAAVERSAEPPTSSESHALDAG